MSQDFANVDVYREVGNIVMGAVKHGIVRIL